MATLYKTDGEVLEIHPHKGGDLFDLKEMQGFVNGYIELIRCRKPLPKIRFPL